MSSKSMCFYSFVMVLTKLVGAFSHEVFDDVAWLKSCGQSYELGFIGGVGNCD